MNEIQNIKIFIASSTTEFKEERNRIELFFTRLNNVSLKKGIYFEVVRCEELSAAMNLQGKQEELNKRIKDCKYFCMFIGKKLGEYTREEFDVAWNTFKISEKYPIIYPFFIKKDENEEQGDDVKGFITYLQEKLEHFTDEYTSFDAVLLRISLELIENQELGSVAFVDGQARLENQELVSLNEIPIYSGNEELQKVNRKIDEIDEKYIQLIEADSDDITGKVRKELEKVVTERIALHNRRRQIQDAIYENYNKIVNSKNAGPYEEKAMSLMSRGKVKDALIILQDEQYETEIQDTVARLKFQGGNPREKIESYISTKKYLISVIKTTGLDDDKIDEIEKIYDELASLTIEFHLSPVTLFEYMVFLHKTNKYKKSVSIAEKLEAFYKLFGEDNEKNLVELYAEWGKIYYDNRKYEKTEEKYKSAIEICGGKNDALSGLLIEIYNALGEMGWKLKHINESQEHLNRARELLNDENVKKATEEQFYKKQLAYNYGCFALCYRAEGKYSLSIENHMKAAEIRKELMEINFEEYADEYAQTCNNLAFVYRDLHRIDEAILSINKTIEVREKLLKYNPISIRGSLGLTYTNIGMFYNIANRVEEAKKYLEKGIEIRREMSEANPGRYEPALAISYLRYAECLLLMKKIEEAAEYLNMALEIWNRYIKDQYDAYVFWIFEAKVLSAELRLSMGDYLSAEKNCKEAIELRKEMARRNLRVTSRIDLVASVVFAYTLSVSQKTAEAADLINHDLEKYKSDEYSQHAFFYGTSLLQINLAIILIQQGERQKAREKLLQTLEDFRSVVEASNEKYDQMSDFIKTYCENTALESGSFNTSYCELVTQFQTTLNFSFEEYNVLRFT